MPEEEDTVTHTRVGDNDYRPTAQWVWTEGKIGGTGSLTVEVYGLAGRGGVGKTR